MIHPATVLKQTFQEMPVAELRCCLKSSCGPSLQHYTGFAKTCEGPRGSPRSMSAMPRNPGKAWPMRKASRSRKDVENNAIKFNISQKKRLFYYVDLCCPFCGSVVLDV